MYYILLITGLAPSLAFACFGDTEFELWLQLILALAIPVIPLSLIFYAILRLVPYFKNKGVRWARIRTLIFAVVIGIVVARIILSIVSSVTLVGPCDFENSLR